MQQNIKFIVSVNLISNLLLKAYKGLRVFVLMDHKEATDQTRIMELPKMSKTWKYVMGMQQMYYQECKHSMNSINNYLQWLYSFLNK